MHHLLPILVAIAVAWHTVAGCCMHHAHAQRPTETKETCSHQHGDAGHSDIPVDSGCPAPEPDDCDESRCIFALSKSVVVQQTAAFVSPVDFVAIEPTGRGFCFGRIGDINSNPRLPATAAPLRSHLALHVLLI